MAEIIRHMGWYDIGRIDTWSVQNMDAGRCVVLVNRATIGSAAHFTHDSWVNENTIEVSCIAIPRKNLALSQKMGPWEASAPPDSVQPKSDAWITGNDLYRLIALKMALPSLNRRQKEAARQRFGRSSARILSFETDSSVLDRVQAYEAPKVVKNRSKKSALYLWDSAPAILHKVCMGDKLEKAGTLHDVAGEGSNDGCDSPVECVPEPGPNLGSDHDENVYASHENVRREILSLLSNVDAA